MKVCWNDQIPAIISSNDASQTETFVSNDLRSYDSNCCISCTFQVNFS